ncbi:MAG TPA: hypothetical protein VF128_09815 [Gemmatimonadaceae bacterium]
MVALLATFCSCANVRPERPRAVLCLEGTNGVVREIPLIALDTAGQLGVLDGAALCELGTRSLCNGMSGAPLYVDGELLGVLVNVQAPADETQCFRYEAIERVRFWADVARQQRPAGATREALALVPDSSERGGSLIAVPYLWGDFKWGLIGALCYVAADEFAAFGHQLTHGDGGEVDRPVMAVRLLCIAELNGERYMIGDIGAELGRVYWEGPTGPVGTLGQRSPRCVLRIRGSQRWWRGEDCEAEWCTQVAACERAGLATDGLLSVIVGRLGTPQAGPTKITVAADIVRAHQVGDPGVERFTDVVALREFLLRVLTGQLRAASVVFHVE